MALGGLVPRVGLPTRAGAGGEPEDLRLLIAGIDAEATLQELRQVMLVDARHESEDTSASGGLPACNDRECAAALRWSIRRAHRAAIRSALSAAGFCSRSVSRDDDPRCEEIAALLDDIEAMYRAAPAAASLGLPVAELVRDYRVARANSLADDLPYQLDPREWSRLLRRFPSPEFEDFFFLLTRSRLRARHPLYGSLLIPPEHPLRVRELSMRSPFDF